MISKWPTWISHSWQTQWIDRNASWFVFLRLSCILHGLSCYPSRPKKRCLDPPESSSKAHTQRRKQNRTPPLGWSELVAPHRSHIRLSGSSQLSSSGWALELWNQKNALHFSLKKSCMMTSLAWKNKPFEWNRKLSFVAIPFFSGECFILFHQWNCWQFDPPISPIPWVQHHL